MFDCGGGDLVVFCGVEFKELSLVMGLIFSEVWVIIVFIFVDKLVVGGIVVYLEDVVVVVEMLVYIFFGLVVFEVIG